MANNQPRVTTDIADNILRVNFRKKAHCRASSGHRAASATNVSALTPAAFGSGDPSTALHHSSGIRSRCHHLETAEPLAPISAPIASLDGQSSIIERNEAGPDMDAVLGQFVLKSKANVSYDYGICSRDNGGMAERMSETEETLAFVRRVRLAREAKFSTQKPVYTALGIPQDQYKHYETKRPLPRRYIPKFCVLTEVGMEWLLTGEGKGGPAPIEYPKETPTRTKKPPKRRAA